MKPEMCWKQLQGQTGSALLPSPDWSVDLKAEYEEQNEQAERYEQKQGRPKNQGKTAPNSMICSQILYTKSQEDQWAIPEKSSLNFNCNSENQRDLSKNEFFPQKGKSAWSWCMSGIDSNHLVELFITRQSINWTKQITQKNINQEGEPVNSNSWKRKTRTQTHIRFPHPEDKKRLGPPFPVPNHTKIYHEFLVHGTSLKSA